MFLVKWPWLLFTVAIAAVLGTAASSAATFTPRARAVGSALRPRTLVTTSGKVWTFAQDDKQIAWIGRPHHGGCGLHVRTIRTGRTVTTRLTKLECEQYSAARDLALANRTAAWVDGYSCGNNECFWNTATATAGGRRAQNVDRADVACNPGTCQGGVTEGRPLLAAAGRRVIYSDGQGNVERIQGGRALPLFQPAGNVYGLAAGPGLIATASESLAQGDGCGCLNLPAWSPDGSKIAYLHGTFTRNNGLNAEIAVMNADGSGRHDITPRNGVSGGTSLSWSPDGTKIAYDGSADGLIWVVSADGSFLSKLTQGSSPTWSPDGTKIAFARIDSSTNTAGLYLMNADGSNVQQLTSFNQPTLRDLAWSPDGKRIAFSLGGVLQMMNADGSNLHLLGNAVVGDNPAWSPDSSEIAFQGADGLSIIGADGNGLRQLTNGPDEHPNWSPNGKTILFSSDRNDPYANIGVYNDQLSLELFLVDPNGSNLRPLSFTQPSAWVNAVNVYSSGGAPLASLPASGQPIFAGNVVAVGSDQQIALFDARSGASLGVVQVAGGSGSLAMVGADPNWVVFRVGRTISALELGTHELVRLARVAASAAYFSVSGRRVAWVETVPGGGGRTRVRAVDLLG